jgi:hypothetical protein
VVDNVVDKVGCPVDRTYLRDPLGEREVVHVHPGTVPCFFSIGENTWELGTGDGRGWVNCSAFEVRRTSVNP